MATVTLGPTRLAGPATSYRITLAAGPDDVRAAAALRHQVFAGELGAQLRSGEPGLDLDEFDQHCDHLLVRTVTGEVVGTYRMLPAGRAARLGRIYSDGEFDLATLDPLRAQLVEAGRSCVAAAHRNGAVISLMWAGIAEYLHRYGHRWLAGCASVPAAGGAPEAVWELAHPRHLAPEHLRVIPRQPYQLGPVPALARPALLGLVPPLLRGYLRLGAWVCGPPAHDPDFGVADFFVLLSIDRADQRYLRHYLGRTVLG